MRAFLFLLAFVASFAQASGTVTTYVATYSSISASPQSSAATACAKLKGIAGLFPNYTAAGATDPSSTGGACMWRTYSETIVYYGTWSATTQECPDPNVVTNGVCGPAPNLCTAKKDTPTATWEEFASADAYRASCKVSVDGCVVDTCSGSAPTQCATDGKTGKMACWGSGNFTGEQSTGTDVPANPTQPPKPEPTVTSQSQSCTAPAVNSGTTTYTCQTDSNATEFASSNCAVGTVNGVQGLHCTKPDYVPEHDGKTRTDEVKEVTNPDGSKTTTTTSTTTTTHCAAGACNTTTNVTTTTGGKDASGNPTGTTTTCKGDNCDNPTTPGKDESEEEEDEEEGTATPFVPGDKGDYLPEIGGGDEAPTYAESLDDFTDRVSNAPIVSGLTSISVPSGGSCSMGSAQLFGGSVSFNDFCTMAPQVLAGLRYLFLAIWAWAAIRLFFTA